MMMNSLRESQKIVLVSIATSSALVGLIAVLAILGQVFEVARMHHWIGTVGMAFNTALCFVLLALNWLVFLHYFSGADDAD